MVLPVCFVGMKDTVWKFFFEILTIDTFFLCIFAVVKIKNAIDCFAEYVGVERRLASGTVKYYVEVVEQFARFMESRQVAEVEEINGTDVRDWQMSLMDAGKRPGTVVKDMAALRAWFKYLRMHQGLGRDIMARVVPPKRPERLPVFFRESEVEQIYSEDFPDTFDGQMERLVLRMLYETGMRRSELAGLTLSSVDLSSLSIKVRGKRNKERIIPIEAELAHNISRYLALREETMAVQAAQCPGMELTDRLFVNSKGKPVSDGKVYRIVERYMRPLSHAERTSPHVFRHTFATHMLNEGANIDAIKELLGHSSLSSTEIYTHVSREYLKETYKHAHPRAYKK